MSAFDYFQLLVNLVFLFLILLLLVGRGWRGSAAGSDEQESYREMMSTLSVLIKEMKETSADLQERLSEKQLEVQRAIAASDERIEKLKEMTEKAPLTPPPSPFTPLPPEGGEGRVRGENEASPQPTSVAGNADSSEARQEKYRQVLDFSQKGFSALDIAKLIKLPRGEVELLIRTKGKQV